MAIKVEKINNALVITDTVSGDTIVDCPSRLVYYDVEELEKNNNVRIVNIDADMGDVVHRRFATYPIGAGLVDTNPTAFTVASWKTFARTNLG